MKANIRIVAVDDKGDEGDLVHLPDTKFSDGRIRVDRSYDIDALKALAGKDGLVHLAFIVS